MVAHSWFCSSQNEPHKSLELIGDSKIIAEIKRVKDGSWDMYSKGMFIGNEPSVKYAIRHFETILKPQEPRLTHN